MEILAQFVVAAIMATCLGVGYIIKHSLDFIPNNYIPLILGVLGVLLAVLHFKGFSVVIFLKGLASGLAATGAFELQRNLKE